MCAHRRCGSITGGSASRFPGISPMPLDTNAHRKAIVAWYRRRASIRLQAGVKKWLPRFGGGEPPDVLIRDQRQRWGSCAPDGTMRFNWRVMMLEPALVDYVIVHELAHLIIRNHSDDY